MKLWWSLILVGLVLSIMITTATADLWEENDKEVLVRIGRATNTQRGSGSSTSCRYSKGEWSECDTKTNTRSRTLTLKKGDKGCEPSKTISKKCRKACRYERGSWMACENQWMARIDTLKANSDTTCEKSRRVTKRCKPENNTKKAKGDRSNKQKSGKQ